MFNFTGRLIKRKATISDKKVRDYLFLNETKQKKTLLQEERLNGLINRFGLW
jgi:hypothetical protein